MKTITRDAEVQLIEAITDMQDDSSRYVAVRFNFSYLLEHYRNESQFKIALNLIRNIVGENEVTLYLCDDSTIFIVIMNSGKVLADKLIFQLRYLFMDDPLAYNGDGEENPAFADYYDLSEGVDSFMKVCKSRLSNKIKKTGRESAAAVGNKDNLPQQSPLVLDTMVKSNTQASENKFFNAAHLSNIERDLTNADISKVVRRQPICAAVPETMVRRVFDELYINIAHLRKVLGGGVDLLSNRWLFKYLTQILDERMLSLLQRSPGRYLDNPISLNLNIHTLLSNRFAEFDASIKPAVKVSIVIEIQLADVFADMAAFLVAKDAVQKLGYRVCLDGVTDLSFTQIDRKRLGFDLVKLQWNANITSELNSAINVDLAKAIRECGVNRVILTRCDSREAVDYGQAMGISLYQGRYLDLLMNPKASFEN